MNRSAPDPGPDGNAPPLATAFVLKIAERCNLNCSYCYMYNKGDLSYLRRPKFMSSEVGTCDADAHC